MAPPISPTTPRSSRPPPSGPKALRPNGLPARPEIPKSSPSSSSYGGRSDDHSGPSRVSIAFPSLPARPETSSSSRSRGVNLDSKSVTNGHSSHPNGSSSSSSWSSSHAESSRHASSTHRSSRDSHEDRYTDRQRESKQRSKSRSVSPVKGASSRTTSKTLDSPPHRHVNLPERNGSVKGKEVDYRTSFLSTTESSRSPISFSIPSTGPSSSNGQSRNRPQLDRALPPHLSKERALPPHLDRDRSRPRSPTRDQPSPPPPPAEPPPPDDRPPTPPPPDDEDLIPPPPDQQPPTPPPPPEQRLPSPPTPDPPSRPPSPSVDSNEGTRSKEIDRHQNDRPRLQRDPPPHTAMSQDDESRFRRMRDPPPHTELPKVTEPVAREPTPLPPWEAPPSVHRRPGHGNFVVLHDPALHGPRGGKDVRKRFDGDDNGQIVAVKDPRLAMSKEARMRGRGSAKSRSEVYELEYEWNNYSTGPKPPPPPPAVLITDLNPLTTVDQISKHLRPYGRIREIDSKMDPKSGMQLGICWVKFDGPSSGRPGTAHDVAVNVVKTCHGQRIGLAGNEKITVVLDGRGLRAEKAVKEEMSRRYPPKRPAPPPPPKVASPAQTPRSSEVAPTPLSGHATPRVDTLKGSSFGPTSSPPAHRPFHTSLPTRPAQAPWLARALPTRPTSNLSRPPGLPSRPTAQTHNLASSFVDAPFAPRSHRPQYDSYRREYSRRSRSRSRSSSRSWSRYRSRRARSHSCSTCSSYSESEDDRPVYRRRGRSPSPRRDRGRGRAGPGRAREDSAERKANEAAQEKAQAAVKANGHPYVFIESTSLPSGSVGEEHLKNHFRAFKPSQASSIVISTSTGWYILFADDVTALKTKILDNTAVQGHRIVIQVKSPSSQTVDDGVAAPTSATAVPGTTAARGAWRFLTITKKNRPAPIPAPAPVAAKRGRSRTRSPSTSSSSEDEMPSRRRSPSLSSMSDLSENELRPAPARSAKTIKSVDSDEEVSLAIPPASDTATPSDVTMDDVGPKGKKRPAKTTKVAKKAKKARITSPVIDLERVETPPVAEIRLDMDVDEKVSPAVAEIKPAKPTKPKKPAKNAVDKFLDSGVVEDQEDAYWLGVALAAAHDGLNPELSDDEADAMLDDNGQAMNDKHPLYHTSGSWRAEGWKKVPQVAKSVYLPQRNQAQISQEDASASTTTTTTTTTSATGSGLTSGRTARVTGRRLAHDMETTRKTTAASNTAESDSFAFNQLRIRKKQLRFARSAIEGYGLYAMETIQPGEMVCEYVGEICRSAVAEIREQRYLKQGIGSSYLFRIDGDMICDATFRGSVSRLINHSCDPTASAKIISINGQSKIVIYAKTMLQPGEEILYDYKFPLESDPALRVPCLCGAKTCRGWLN